MKHSNEMDTVRAFRENIPVDVKGLIQALGIEYKEVPMPSDQSGRIDCEADWDDDVYRITVNATEGGQRRRFTAAHELGHYLLHRDLLGEGGHLDRLYSDPVDNPYAPFSPSHEVQANQFAAELLMPAGRIREMYDQTNDNVIALANAFNVSPAAMRIRLKTLGLRANAA